jgi:hypothetical protein
VTTAVGVTVSVVNAGEEPSGRVPVAAGRHVHVDDLPVLVDGPVHVAPHTIDFDVGFVD